MKRWPLIRHVRWWWHKRQVEKWYIMWADMGYGPDEAQRLNAIWTGKA